MPRKPPDLMKIYSLMFDRYGPRRWWPGDTREEILIGAILTQNTAWVNVEKAIANLKESLQAAYAAEDRLKALLQREGLME